MTHRFFHLELTSTGTVVLEGAEAHHLMHVLRATAGDRVELFNGAGLVATAQVLTVRRRDADLQIVESRTESKPARQIVLGTAVPKGDRFEWLVEKATELGVTRLVPLATTRSVVDPRESKLEKLRQAVIAACKQSRRNWLMEVSAVTPWKDFVAGDLAVRPSVVAHPCDSAVPVSSIRFDELSDVACAIGPEGGFTDDEVALAVAQGSRLMSMGPLILRIETAALVCASMCLSSGEVRSSLEAQE
jgi:16S rRNA (uracil1498-N3)-methyltransferase